MASSKEKTSNVTQCLLNLGNEGKGGSMMNKRRILKHLGSLSLLILLLVILPIQARAAGSTYLMLKGQTGTMSMTGNVVPNAKWKSSKPSVLKITKTTSSSVSVKGMKAGTATLTVYNKKKPSQKHSYTIRVLTPNKLIKSDFTVSGSQLKDYLNTQKTNLVDYVKKKKSKGLIMVFDIESADATYSNTKNYMLTWRGAHIYSTYAEICRLYGKKP